MTSLAYDRALTRERRRADLADECGAQLAAEYRDAVMQGHEGTVRAWRVSGTVAKAYAAPIADVLLLDLDPDELLCAIRDAIRGEDVQLRLSLMVSIAANKHADLFKGEAMEEVDA